MSRQNIERKELGRKIFQNRELAASSACRLGYEFFEGRTVKILISKDLTDAAAGLGLQNIEPQGLTGKIFQNKELQRTSGATNAGFFVAGGILPTCENAGVGNDGCFDFSRAPLRGGRCMISVFTFQGLE